MGRYLNSASASPELREHLAQKPVFLPRWGPSRVTSCLHIPKPSTFRRLVSKTAIPLLMSQTSCQNTGSFSEPETVATFAQAYISNCKFRGSPQNPLLLVFDAGLPRRLRVWCFDKSNSSADVEVKTLQCLAAPSCLGRGSLAVNLKSFFCVFLCLLRFFFPFLLYLCHTWRMHFIQPTF